MSKKPRSRNGFAAVRDPVVDDLYYYARNPDVWLAGADADAHYHSTGWKEGRDPNAFFSTKGYLAAYTDVKAAGVNPLDHYDTWGFKGGRDPSHSRPRLRPASR